MSSRTTTTFTGPTHDVEQSQCQQCKKKLSSGKPGSVTRWIDVGPDMFHEACVVCITCRLDLLHADQCYRNPTKNRWYCTKCMDKWYPIGSAERYDLYQISFRHPGGLWDLLQRTLLLQRKQPKQNQKGNQTTDLKKSAHVSPKVHRPTGATLRGKKLDLDEDAAARQQSPDVVKRNEALEKAIASLPPIPSPIDLPSLSPRVGNITTDDLPPPPPVPIHGGEETESPRAPERSPTQEQHEQLKRRTPRGDKSSDSASKDAPAKICKACNQAVDAARPSTFVTAFNQQYHTKCFHCSKCNEEPSLTSDNTLFCPSHIPASSGGVVRHCAVCDQEILRNDEKGKVGHNYYHQRCMKCESCDDQSETQDFKLLNDKIYCAPCHRVWSQKQWGSPSSRPKSAAPGSLSATPVPRLITQQPSPAAGSKQSSEPASGPASARQSVTVSSSSRQSSSGSFSSRQPATSSSSPSSSTSSRQSSSGSITPTPTKSPTNSSNSLTQPLTELLSSQSASPSSTRSRSSTSPVVVTPQPTSNSASPNTVSPAASSFTKQSSTRLTSTAPTSPSLSSGSSRQAPSGSATPTSSPGSSTSTRPGPVTTLPNATPLTSSPKPIPTTQPNETLCPTCNKPLGSKIMIALEKKWHPDCFVCAICKGSLRTGFILRNGVVICEKAACKAAVPVTSTRIPAF